MSRPIPGLTADYQSNFVRHSSSPIPLEQIEPVSGYGRELLRLIGIASFVAVVWFLCVVLH
jgi:hypothetical protein